MIDRFPRLVTEVKDKSGQLPIHVACNFAFLDTVYTGSNEANQRIKEALEKRRTEEIKVRYDAIEQMLDLSDNRIACVKDNNGRLPLHVATWRKAPYDVVSLI